MSGSDAEFVKLLSKHHNALLCHILFLWPHYEEAVDIMQNTSMLMWERRGDFQLGTNFVAWGKKIAYYQVLDFRKKKARQQKVIFSEEMVNSIAQNQCFQESFEPSMVQRLSRCLDRMSANDQKILRLKYWKSISTSEISKALRMSVRTVYYHLARIQGMLLMCVEGDD